MLIVASDNLIWLLGLVDNAIQPPSEVANATVTGTLYDMSGNIVGGPISMTYVSGSVTVTPQGGQPITSAVGNYKGQLPYTTPTVDGSSYILDVLCVGIDGSHRHFKGPIQAGNSLE